MTAKPPADDVPVRAIDRFLAFAALGIAAASVLCFFAIIIASSAAGLTPEDFGVGLWPLIAAIPLWGLPIAFAMIIALLIMSFARRGRAARRS